VLRIRFILTRILLRIRPVKNSNFFSSGYPQNYLLYINIENINLPEKKFLITIFYVSTVKSNQVFVICDFSMKIENKKKSKMKLIRTEPDPQH